MKDRVERRLQEITEEFLKRTEISAQKIFDKNHTVVFGALDACNKRVQEIFDYHAEQKRLFD